MCGRPRSGAGGWPGGGGHLGDKVTGDRSGRSPSSDGCRANRLPGRGRQQQQVPSYGAGGRRPAWQPVLAWGPPWPAGPSRAPRGRTRSLSRCCSGCRRPPFLARLRPRGPPQAHLTRGSAGGPEAGPARAPAGRKSQPRQPSMYVACTWLVVSPLPQPVVRRKALVRPHPGRDPTGQGSRARGPRGLC